MCTFAILSFLWSHPDSFLFTSPRPDDHDDDDAVESIVMPRRRDGYAHTTFRLLFSFFFLDVEYGLVALSRTRLFAHRQWEWERKKETRNHLKKKETTSRIRSKALSRAACVLQRKKLRPLVTPRTKNYVGQTIINLFVASFRAVSQLIITN